ncbi:MAG: hypothetical protein P8X82_00785 [Gemmatimonadales bacterium]|jgi:hypothetical protein
MTKVDFPPSDWQALGGVAPDALVETRIQLHWAVQVVGAVPLAVLEQAPDFSHANLGWIAEDAAFVTRQVGASPPVRVGLDLLNFDLTVRDAADGVVDTLRLEGKTLDDGYGWIAEMMGRYGVGDVAPEDLHRPDQDFPDHVVRAGAPFTGGEAVARAELAHWYDNTLLLLSTVVRDYDNASPVRTWPHHFDMATLITLESAEDPEEMRSVGVGMVPGDVSYPEPYLYATPWPVPASPDMFPRLEGGGTWHTEGWVGAVLTGSTLVVAGDDPVAQAEQAQAFLASAIPAACEIAGG